MVTREVIAYGVYTKEQYKNRDEPSLRAIDPTDVYRFLNENEGKDDYRVFEVHLIEQDAEEWMAKMEELETVQDDPLFTRAKEAQHDKVR